MDLSGGGLKPDHVREGAATVFEGLFGRSGGDRAADATPKTTTVMQRPSIGLALGGGAARGFAHIGVMRTLLANGIKPDIIVGTSIGAVVGGCYAGGQLDTLEEWARSLTWRGLLGYLDISLSGSGLIRGSQLAGRLEAALGNAHIENLATKFACIATEFSTGHEIWLTRGRVVEALRASYALPGIFPAMRIGGRWLVDGALVNPVPVSAARAFGARLVIAVNVNSELFGRGTTIPNAGTDENDEREHELESSGSGFSRMFGAERALRRQLLGGAGRPGIPTVMIEAFNVMQDRITRARLAGDPPDVSIAPRLGNVGLFEFHKAEEAIRQGADAAEKAITGINEAIAALSHPATEPAAAK